MAKEEWNMENVKMSVMDKKEFKGKVIYAPKGRAGEYGRLACNFFVGCSNACDYCYCKQGFLGRLWSSRPRLKKGLKGCDTALRLFEKELLVCLPTLQQSGLFFSFTSDPFLQEASELTWQAVRMAVQHDVPVQLLTKRADFINHPACLALERYRDLVSFGFTLTGHDEREPGASSNIERVAAMRSLYLRGFKTFASIEPVIDVFSSLDMVKRTVGYCDLYRIGLMSGGGVRYSSVDLLGFVQAVHACVPSSSKVYWKESVRRLVDVHALARDFHHASVLVDADYDLFGRVHQ